MISFIVIGKNIQNTIKISLDSILRFVKFNTIESYEIIYVDSDSNDRTLEIAHKYQIRIFSISGDINSAVARNVGAQNSKGEILFFLDGDMELLPDFFELIFDNKTISLKYPFIRGHMREKYYDSNFNFLYIKDEILAEEYFYEHVTGGLMIVEKILWNRLGGMDERLIRNQDLDFGLRMSRIGYPVLKDNHYWIIHHTVSYLEGSRFKYFSKSKALLTPGILMRKHFFSFYYLKYCRNNIMYALFLLITIIILIFNPLQGLIPLFLYFLIHLIRAIVNINNEKYFFKSFVYKSIFNFYSLMGFLFYYPSKPSYKLTCEK